MRITVVCTPEEHAEIKKRAGLVPLSTYIKNFVLAGVGSEISSSVGKSGVAVAPVRARRAAVPAAARVARVAAAPEPEPESPVVPAGEGHIVLQPESGPKRGHCVHGKKRGEHCWQCGGAAKIGGGELEEPKKKGFKR